ncbi:type VI secretion system baseplate subunit TssE [Afifella marina]|uniref:Type VI secretion system protein ImpF n=1 Tax=Afifella marina DSM 2698 TaxID=1120955 RepID=A0A1G5MPF0_AFIMA|nr:type VI secretion system baseplate subunit TssE [Afifella marina]MBK1623983.1 type VI secretion system baseplate subunit TssE [Afifella marina DSM 2698]MBK1627101.1 type VI secretion system baseplate subunit TssE [Afifella marina]MBK5918870.1 type VI secretion protein [Afifella marina]RAI22526.1 type VI secretion protein [Afifella marina DSM 2698]SCZ26498.1 type VI secretion system protein ImpF [Afifella marina DSM 2698]
MADPLDRFVPGRGSISQPLLDRLLDAEPDRDEDQPLRPVDEVRRLREAIRRDLEALLNTRQPPVSPPPGQPHLDSALTSFGIEGFVGASLGSPAAKARFARAIERRIELFETRLSNVQVTVLKGRGDGDRALRMRIQAHFRVNEAMPPIRLESMVDPSTNRIELEAPGD